MTLITVIRGGGDLASGAALRLYHAGLKVVILELPEPLVVRRAVSFADAVCSGQTQVENITACLVQNPSEVFGAINKGKIPVLIDPDAGIIHEFKSHQDRNQPIVIVDARMTKQPPEKSTSQVDLLIGLGPGFLAGENCDAVIETKRGHNLGRVYWLGSCEENTGIPDSVVGIAADRVVRAPVDGTLSAYAQIGDHLEKGDLIAEIQGVQVIAPIKGVLRGLLHPGIMVKQGMKIGDVDPRDDPAYCWIVSDKSLAVGGGVLEAILSRPQFRAHLWDLNATG